MPSNSSSQSLKIAIVAGEASGDILGAGLISAIKKQYPASEFFGVGGERMLAKGFQSWFSMDRLAVMGLIEPLKRIFELLSMRKQIRKRLLASPPDVFIGIDAPDFNLSLEEKLKEQGIKVVHYVSPSVWAWRQGRIKKISRAVDLMLTLFPFEERFYQDHKVKVCCVGHTLADTIPLDPDTDGARKKLNTILQTPSKHSSSSQTLIDQTSINQAPINFEGKQAVGVLPGSRASEVRFHTRLFLQAARLCWQKNSKLFFLIPAANSKRYEEIEQVLRDFPELPVRLILKHSHEVMAACDVLLLASGTTALEAMLLKRPMLISYKMSGLAFKIIKSMVSISFVGLPNLLAGKALVPELLQSEATPENLARVMNDLLVSKNEEMIKEFYHWHRHLRRNANEAAANAVLALIKEAR